MESDLRNTAVRLFLCFVMLFAGTQASGALLDQGRVPFSHGISLLEPTPALGIAASGRSISAFDPGTRSPGTKSVVWTKNLSKKPLALAYDDTAHEVVVVVEGAESHRDEKDPDRKHDARGDKKKDGDGDTDDARKGDDGEQKDSEKDDRGIDDRDDGDKGAGNDRDRTVIIFLDVDTGIEVRRVTFDRPVRGMALDPADGRVLLLENGGKRLHALHRLTGEVEYSTVLPEKAEEIGIDPVTGTVACWSKKRFLILDPPGAVLFDREFETKIEGVFIDGRTDMAAVTLKDGGLAVVDLVSLSVREIQPAWEDAEHPPKISEILLWGDRIFLGDRTRDEVVEIDIADGSILSRTGAGPKVGPLSRVASYVLVSTKEEVRVFLNEETPVPAITGIAPASFPVGGPPPELVVTGRNFRPDSSVRLDGAALPVTFVDDTELRAGFPPDLAGRGAEYGVVVENPGGYLSNEVVVTVTNPVPEVFSAVPSDVVEDRGSMLLDVYGSGFVPDTLFLYSSTPRDTSITGEGTGAMALRAEDTALPGTYPIRAFNPPPGGGYSPGAFWFRVTPANNHPVAVINGPYEGTAGTPIDFSASGSLDPDGDALAYLWDFGDGTTGTGPNPAHTYATPGTFTVTLTVSDGRGGVSTASTAVVITDPPHPTALTVTCSAHTLNVGEETACTAVVAYSDGSTRDITAEAAWSVGDPSVLGVMPGGVVAGLSEGTSTVSAATADGMFSGSVPFTVVSPVLPESITVWPDTASIRVDGTVALRAEILYSDGSRSDATASVGWSIDNPAAAAVSGGLVTGIGPGTATVTAVDPVSGLTARGTLTVLSAPAPAPLTEDSFGKRYEDLVPADATVEAYDEHRFAVVTGLVVDRSGASIPGVRVSVHEHAEYGSALTDQAGRFSLPVEGGGTLTMVYEGPGLITSHRQVHVPWNDIAVADTVKMLAIDPVSTRVTFDGNPGTVITHRSSVTTDEFGGRALTMVFRGDNRAFVKNPDGTETEIASFTARATEFDTEDAMPAKLPPSSGYTYCSELSIDEAENVRFEKPVTFYVDNFLGFPVGMIVPVGYYDRDRAVWVASENGVVVELLDTDGDGAVDALDTTGDGVADDLDGDGLFADEVAGVSDPAAYPPGMTLWRVEIDHFTPFDCNWPYGPPLGSTGPDGPGASGGSGGPGGPGNGPGYGPDGGPTGGPGGGDPENGPKERPEEDERDCINSYVVHRGRVFHEDIPIPGTDMTLHYSSKRTAGYPSVITNKGLVPSRGTRARD